MKNLILALSVLVSSQAFAKTGYLVITTNEDIASENRGTLDAPKAFKVDLAFVAKMNPEFYLFLGSDFADSVCFGGDATEAMKVVDAILAVPTGDAFVYPAKKVMVTADKISRAFRYDDEGGSHFKTASAKRCAGL